MNAVARQQMIEWAEAVAAAYVLDGYVGARELLKHLTIEHRFDEVGLDIVCGWLGTSQEVRNVYRALKHHIDFGALYGAEMDDATDSLSHKIAQGMYTASLPPRHSKTRQLNMQQTPRSKRR